MALDGGSERDVTGMASEQVLFSSTPLPQLHCSIVARRSALLQHRKSYLFPDDSCHYGSAVLLIGLTHQGTSCHRCTKSAQADPLQLSNSLSMPAIHLGVYLTSGHETSQAVRWALEVCTVHVLCRYCARGCDIELTPAGWLSRVRRGRTSALV